MYIETITIILLILISIASLAILSKFIKSFKVAITIHVILTTIGVLIPFVSGIIKNTH